MLTDCISRNTSETELFMVQEQDAGFLRSVECRDRNTQAILPIGEGMITVKGAKWIDVLENPEARSIVAALGIGFCLNLKLDSTSDFDLEGLRYGKIILVFDDTFESRYVREQLVAFFYRFMRPLIRSGKVYLLPPDALLGLNEAIAETKIYGQNTRTLIEVKKPSSR